ncbi:MAG TPA: hypothetical protein EYG95_00985 [Campylobacterales bacterium]|nr:hypothetical protein [Campylobacterales bacterium]
MSDFTTSIQNISNVYGVAPVYTPRQTQQIATIIKNGTIDSVNFSDESQNLFQISQINGRFDDLLGVPSTLTSSQQSELEKLGFIAENLFSNGSLKPASTDYDAILENINKLYEGKELDSQTEQQLLTLTGELQSYVQNLSITQLFSSSTVSSTNTFFNERLTDSEKSDLGKVAQQLNRVLFTSTDDTGSSFLDSLNSLYGLNTPSIEEENDIFSLFSQRNSLLTSVLLNRNLASNYGDLL